MSIFLVWKRTRSSCLPYRCLSAFLLWAFRVSCLQFRFHLEFEFSLIPRPALVAWCAIPPSLSTINSYLLSSGARAPHPLSSPAFGWSHAYQINMTFKGSHLNLTKALTVVFDQCNRSFRSEVSPGKRKGKMKTLNHDFASSDTKFPESRARFDFPFEWNHTSRQKQRWRLLRFHLYERHDGRLIMEKVRMLAWIR